MTTQQNSSDAVTIQTCIDRLIRLLPSDVDKLRVIINGTPEKYLEERQRQLEPLKQAFIKFLQDNGDSSAVYLDDVAVLTSVLMSCGFFDLFKAEEFISNAEVSSAVRSEVAAFFPSVRTTLAEVPRPAASPHHDEVNLG
jgi:hypothetical protein